jgi:hypothetical protein
VATPDEFIAALLSGWATAWAGTAIGMPGPWAIIVGLLMWAIVTGRYRRRYGPTPTL